MAINLKKGDRISLTKEAPGLTQAKVGLGWDVNATDTGSAFDLDVSVFMLGANGKIPDERYFVFYNNLQSLDGSVQSMGDSRTGEGSGDDETITVDLPKVNSAIQEMLFVVTIHEAETRRQNFGQIRNAYIRIDDAMTQSEVVLYDLDEDFSRETAVEFGRLYMKDGEWRFQAVGQGYNSGLASFVEKYT
ncbi:MAG: TerD family protein [Oscillatoriales cyanobacterium RM2_1_1]|nr:TerD family protein [Oscillatoriales cyanobacterium SM2_3_0]NJO44272.1 TerD family protein [Oscillatoriales cyanobacterium RM2_1_1]